MTLLFPVRRRIKHRSEIDSVYRKGRKLSGKLIRIYILKTTGTEPRLAVNVPRRVARSAVERNRWKRLVRESFRLHQDQIPPCDLLVIPNLPVGDLKRADVDRELLSLLKRGGYDGARSK